MNLRRGRGAARCSLRALLLASAGLAAGAQAATAQPPAHGDWPFYGHDIANSRDAGQAGPSAVGAATLSRAWDFAAPVDAGDFTGTPVVAQGTVAVGSVKGRVFALDAATGALKWSRNLNPDDDPNRTINGSAAIVGRRVYVPFAQYHRPQLVALDLRDGSTVWDSVLDRQKDSDTWGSPIVWKRSVYIGTSGAFGEVNDPNVSVRGSVVALNARTGKRRWKTYTVPKGRDGGGVWTTGAIDPRLGRLFVGTGNAYHAPAADTTDAMLALSLRTGKIVARFQATPDDVWTETTNFFSGPDADFGASPNLVAGPGGRPLVGEGQKSGAYWAVDRRTLAPVWHTSTGPGAFVGGILGSTAYDGKRIYGPDTLGGELFALDRAGAVQWASSGGDPIHFNPVSVANGVVYTAELTGFLTARDARTGVLLSRQPLGWGAFGGVAIARGTVYAVTGTSGGTSFDTGGRGHVEAFRPLAG